MFFSGIEQMKSKFGQSSHFLFFCFLFFYYTGVDVRLNARWSPLIFWRKKKKKDFRFWRFGGITEEQVILLLRRLIFLGKNRNAIFLDFLKLSF